MKLLNDLVIYSNRVKGIDYESDILRIKEGFITVKANFEWNGCTWVRDGERNKENIPVSWRASCVHDALYLSKIPKMDRKIKDLIFYDELKKIKFKFLKIIPAAYMYYVGVSWFGGFFYRGNYESDKEENVSN